MGSRLSTRLQSVAVAFALVATMVVILPNQPVVAQTEPTDRLQALIDAAEPGAVINVPVGTYTENVIIGDGKTLRGSGATAAEVVIDGEMSGPTVTIGAGNVTLENLTVTGGSGVDGGGVSIGGTGQTINIIDVRITDNEAQRGGGLWADAGNTVRIERSTIDNNNAFSDLGTTGGGVGGAADFTIVNSTLSANSTSGNGAGVGLIGGTAAQNNVTMAFNSAVGQGGAFNAEPGAAITLSNTLSSGNSNANGGPNCDTFASLGHNLFAGNPSECALHPADIFASVALGELADNGGATPTHALPAESPAIDAGSAFESLDYPIFDGATLEAWQLNGTAAAEPDSGSLQLASGTNLVGSAYLSSPVQVDQGFSARFNFTASGADGLTFTVGDSPTALGDSGGFLGIGEYDTIENIAVGVVNGVSIEFDTWSNLDSDAPGANDPGATGNGSLAWNHIGVAINGSLTSISPTVVSGIANGSVWTAWIDYSQTDTTLEIRVSNDGIRPSSPTLSTTAADVAALAGPSAYIGFTGSTGGISGTHRILDLTFVAGTPPCESTDQRTVARPQGDGCDIGAFEGEPQIATALTVDLADAGAIAGSPPIIPIEELDIATFFGAADGPSSTQLGAIQLGAIQLGAIAGTGRSAPSGYLTIETIIDAAAELSASSTILDGITLVDVPVTGGWEAILATSATLAGRPSYTVTLQQVIDDPVIGPGLRDLRLADSGLTASQLSAIQLGAIQLGAIQLSAIQLSAIQLSAIGDQLADICASDDIDCASLGIVTDSTGSYTGFEHYSLAALSLLGVSLDFAQLGAIQLGAIDPTGTQLSAIQLGAIQLDTIQLGEIGTNSATIGNTQLGAIQLGAIQLGAIGDLISIQLGAIATKADLVEYWCTDIASDLDCAALGVTAPYSGDALDSYSIVALGAMGADLSVLQLGAIQLGAIGDLANTQLGAIQLGAIQLSAIAPEDTQLSAIQLSAIQLGAIQLSAIDWDNVVFAQLGAIQLSAIQLSAIQLGAIQLSAISDPSLIVNCGALAGGCAANGFLTLAELEGLGLILPTATLEDLSGAFEDILLSDLGLDLTTLAAEFSLLDLLPETTIAELPDDLTLGDLAELWVGMPVFELLLALLDPADLSWEDVDPAVIAAQHPVLASGWSVMFELAGETGNVAGSEFPFTADVSVTLPDGVAYVPGTSGLAINPEALPPPTTSLPDPLIDGSTLRWIVDGVELNDLFYVEFGLATAYTADTSVPVATTVNTLGFTGADSSPTLVTDLEPNDTFAQAVQVSGDVLVLGRVDTPGDVDMFKLSVPAGGSIEAYLNPGSVDLDLVLFEPGQTVGGELRGPAERVVEGSLDPVIGIDPTEQDQESLDDIANTDLAPVFKSSLHRGDASESIVTPPLRNGGEFYLQVTSYNEVASEDVYVGRIRVIDPPAASVCAARPPTSFNGDGTPGTLPDVTGAETLYLINTELFADTHGAPALNEVLAAITAVNGVTVAPNGVVVPVEGDLAIAAAYNTWLGAGGNCSTDAANAVATAIAELVDGYRTAEPSIASIVIVGGDDQIPFFRVEDQGIVANEREYLTTFTGNNPLVSSLRDGMVMTDAPYTDANPLYVPQGDREVFVTQLPTGRLVEDPAEIVATLNQFVASGGLLDAANTTSPTAEVLGYDFLADSSAAIAAELNNQGFSVSSTINETWTKADLEAAFDSAAAIVDSNAHYDHTAALPAAGNLSSTFTDLYTVADLEPDTSSIYAGTLIYSMGCHSGLNAPASYLSPTDPLYDWAQALLARQAVYVANTGFGFGDSEFQAYSEELMALMTEQFATSNTIGEAFGNAQQIFASQTPKWSPYHDKSLMEATLYGLPFYRLHATEVTPPALETIEPGAVVGGLASASVSTTTPLTAGGGLTEDRYLISDDVLAVPFRPVQPLEYIEITSSVPGLRAVGALIEGGSSTDLGSFDVLYARPIVYNGEAEPEYETLGAFPNALQAVTGYDSPSGPADRLLLARGRYFPSTQTQQVWNSVNLTVYYSEGGATNAAPPQISNVSAVEVSPGEVNFSVSTEADARRVLVLYKASGTTGAWTALELAGSGGIWTAQASGLSQAQDIDYWVQVLGADGQVSTSTDKAELHEVLPPGPPTLLITGTQGTNGIYTTEVTVDLGAPTNAPGAALEISVDGIPFTTYTGPISLSAEGGHEVVARPVGAEESAVSETLVIDTLAPAVNVLEPTGSVVVAQGAPLSLEYFCLDAGSGVAKCEGTVITGGNLDTSVLGLHEAQVTATDRAGNASSVVVPYEVVPLTITADTTVVAVHTDVSFEAAFNDVDESSHSLTWDFGDQETFSQTSASPATVVHPYTTPGVYPVSVTVTHPDGLVQTATLRYIVVYDPTEGFVTGGGWFDSPPNALTPQDNNDTGVVGRADFGFVSKYKKGATVPTGGTAFEFAAGNLVFESTSYEWLVVQGDNKAAFKGVGVIDGWPGEYKFRVTIRDADGNNNDDFAEDSFRIAIWVDADDGTESFVYDNGFGSDPDFEQGGTTPIGGGSIVIHNGGAGGKKN